MAVIYDETGVAHGLKDNNDYQNNDDAFLILKTLFGIDNDLSGDTDAGIKYSRGLGWNDYADPPEDIYIMIGNGFDLECQLPTAYSDYLRFLFAIEKMKKSSFEKKHVKLHSFIQEKLISDTPDYEKWEPVINSFWYNHFIHANIRLGWVDFENEVAKIIQIIEGSFELTLYHQAKMDDYVACMKKSDLNIVLGEFLKKFKTRRKISIQKGQKYIEYNLLYCELRDILLRDLEAFINGFETYLREYVEPIPVKPTINVQYIMKKIKESKKRFVISFNYTTTFEHLLKNEGIDADFCYVHGKIGDGKHKNRMVLGIGEYVRSSAIKNTVGFAPFRKYNQRIFKRTDSNYMDWLAEIDQSSTDKMLYIFGHSIGITDKDIIAPFVLSSNMRTVVFYHREEAFSEKVSNLTAMIGMNEMIRRNGGKCHTMEFLPQM